jgi:hypothetical protein
MANEEKMTYRIANNRSENNLSMHHQANVDEKLLHFVSHGL